MTRSVLLHCTAYGKLGKRNRPLVHAKSDRWGTGRGHLLASGIWRCCWGRHPLGESPGTWDSRETTMTQKQTNDTYEAGVNKLLITGEDSDSINSFTAKSLNFRLWMSGLLAWRVIIIHLTKVRINMTLPILKKSHMRRSHGPLFPAEWS